LSDPCAFIIIVSVVDDRNLLVSLLGRLFSLLLAFLLRSLAVLLRLLLLFPPFLFLLEALISAFLLPRFADRLKFVIVVVGILLLFIRALIAVFLFIV